MDVVVGSCGYHWPRLNGRRDGIECLCRPVHHMGRALNRPF